MISQLTPHCGREPMSPWAETRPAKRAAAVTAKNFIFAIDICTERELRVTVKRGEVED